MKTSMAESGEPQQWKQFSSYSIEVDPDQDDKAKEIKICSFARPHMRAFHMSWIGFFMAFFCWFAIAPFLADIRHDLHITKQDIWTSSIVGVSGTIFMRFLLGPVCDKYGPRIPMAVLLCACAIPTAMTGLVNTTMGLCFLRFFIGLIGGTFVMCQFWTSRFFAKDVVGTANAIVGGWGNLGGGVTHLVMGSVLFPLFKMFFDGDSEKAWRTVCIVPAFVTFILGIVLYRVSDDCPMGNYADLKKHGSMPEISAAASFRSGAVNFNSWLLFIQYACCFGVELTMDNAAALYFKDKFGMSTEEAAAIASIFGWTNICTRGLGGYFSDVANSRLGMRGRLMIQMSFLLAEGILVIIFAQVDSLAGAITVMSIFSVFVTATCGATYGIIPYVDPPSTGSVSGIVGAGGNVGAVAFGLCFRQLEYKQAYLVMGFCILASALTCALVNIKGCSALFFGKDVVVAKTATLTVPEPEVTKEPASERLDL